MLPSPLPLECDPSHTVFLRPDLQLPGSVLAFDRPPYKSSAVWDDFPREIKLYIFEVRFLQMRRRKYLRNRAKVNLGLYVKPPISIGPMYTLLPGTYVFYNLLPRRLSPSVYYSHFTHVWAVDISNRFLTHFFTRRFDIHHVDRVVTRLPILRSVGWNDLPLEIRLLIWKFKFADTRARIFRFRRAKVAMELTLRYPSLRPYAPHNTCMYFNLFSNNGAFRSTDPSFVHWMNCPAHRWQYSPQLGILHYRFQKGPALLESHYKKWNVTPEKGHIKNKYRQVCRSGFEPDSP